MDEHDVNQEDLKRCQYCAEWIRKEAVKCRYCGSVLTGRKADLDFLSTPGYWHRVRKGKKIAGVCTGIANQLNAPVLILPLRLFFILTIPFYGFGIILYIVLWALMPPPIDQDRPGSQGTPSGRAPEDFTYTEGSVPAPEEPGGGETKPDSSAPTAGMFRTEPKPAYLLTIFYGMLLVNALLVLFAREYLPLQREIGFTLVAVMAAVPLLAIARRQAAHGAPACCSCTVKTA